MPCGTPKASSQNVDHSDKNGEDQYCAFQDLDHSILQHPLHSGVKNVKQILKCLQDATKEVKDIILNECNIIYECRVCASLFRGLANFMYHKRCYCKNHLCEEMVLFNNFEEEAVVQPEPSNNKVLEKDITPKLLKCSVDLVKTNIRHENGVLIADSENEVIASGLRQRGVSNKGKKEQVDKKCPIEVKKSEHSMVSRRTRDKNSQKVEKKKGKDSKNITAKTGKKTENETSIDEFDLKNMSNDLKKNKVDNDSEVKEIENTVDHSIKTDHVSKPDNELEMCVEESINEMETNIRETIGDNVETNTDRKDTYNIENEITVNMETDIEKEVPVSNEKIVENEINDEKEIVNKRNSEINDEKEIIVNMEASVKQDIIHDKDKAQIEIMKTLAPVISISESNKMETNFETCTEMVNNEEEIKYPLKTDVQKETCTTDCTKIKKDVVFSTLVDNMEQPIDKSTIKEIGAASKNTELDNIDNSAHIILQPMKKIIFTKSKPIQFKNSAVLDSIRKNLNAEGNIGLTKIAQAAGKNMLNFPKLILKTVDGNPHAVFQTTEKSEIDSSKNLTISNKKENEKLIIVLKKDSFTPEKCASDKASADKESKNLKPTEFHHMTRRKRLLARNDCNVQQLQCLTCNTFFTSVKTLYFHMLSIHSKKRLYYPCPLCKTMFVQMYGVTRHLVSIHKKTREQINKLRDTIKKKTVWKKVDDVEKSECISSDDITVLEKPSIKEKPEIETKTENCAVKNEKVQAVKTIIKLNKNANIHKCSKCNRVFGRKSSQVSHEKFCIMNAIKAEAVDLVSPPTSPPVISFLSFSQRKANAESVNSKPSQATKSMSSEVKVNVRPKRKAEKQMHKDFVNSQTLKWRSVNKITNNPKATSPSVKKNVVKMLKKKVSNIINVDGLSCLKCGKTFSSYSNLKRHVAIHLGWTRFKCKHCEYQAYNKSQCYFHVQRTHDILDNDIEKSIINLGSDWYTKKHISNPPGRPPKNIIDSELKKSNPIPKLKITKKKSNDLKILEKKTLGIKKDNMDNKKDIDSKSTESKKEMLDTKKILNVISKKDDNDLKKERNQNLDTKKVLSDLKKEKTQAVNPIYKCTVQEYKKDSINYKSLTTNKPTTIILSKKLPTSSVQSVVTIPTESTSSSLLNKTFPLRSSPRKIETTKFPEEKGNTSLVTRSAAYAKSSIQIKITPPRPNSVESSRKPLNPCMEKGYAKKEKLISEWFPKKDLNSNTSRRESAPLIIGLVPATNSNLTVRSKNPAITYEKNNS